MTRRPLLLLTTLLAACGGNTYAPPPAAEVVVAHPIEQEVTTYSEFSGHTTSVAAIDVRARVQGYLQSMHFTAGTDVKQGDLLFVIEPDLYAARVTAAEADLQSAQAQREAADEQYEITNTIFQRNAGSKTDLVQKLEAKDQAHAAEAQARAKLAQAKLDLSYTRIYAPITGRIDRNFVDVGNLVGSGEPTLLATVVQHDPIYVYFDVSERDLLDYRERRRRGETASAEGQRTPAYLGLLTEQGFPHEGEVNYSSNRVDPSTGTIELRAVFPNPDHTIVPGLFGRVRLPFTRGSAILVPDEAVSTDQAGRFVLTVDDKNVVQHQRVTVGALVGQMRIILNGLDTKAWVVVNGLQRARPGGTVKPVPAPVTAPEPAQVPTAP